MKEKKKTIKIKTDYYVGWFTGKQNQGRFKKFIGVGSSYVDEPSMGEWLTVPEARKLRDALTRLLGD